MHSGKAVKTAGRWTVMVCAAPQGDLASVLSADGERKVALKFLGGGKSYSGTYLHECRRLTTAERLGEPVVLADVQDRGQLAAQWTPDGLFTVYNSVRFDSLWIAVNEQTFSKKEERQ